MNFKSFNDSDPRDSDPDLWNECYPSETRKDFETRLKSLWWMLEDVKRTVDFMQGDIPDCMSETETHSYFDLLETIYHTMDVLKTTVCTILERNNEQSEHEKKNTEVPNE